METSDPMKPGRNLSVRLKFMYKLSEGVAGFYLSTYKDKAGNTRKLDYPL